MNLPPLFGAAPRTCSSILVTVGQAQEWVASSGRPIRAVGAAILPTIFVLVTTRQEIYNVLWALVFGFATVNILSLGARRIDPKGGLHFGEVLAILIVLVSIVLLGWEMLYVFHILPIRLSPR
jgi:hypothetical protein